MTELLKTFSEMLFFKKGPQDIPADKTLLNITILVNVLISFIPNDENYRFILALSTSIVYVISTLAFIQISLNIKANMSNDESFKNRFIQVCTSILGIHAFIALFTSLVFIVSANQDSMLIIILLATIYSWLIFGFIFKNALDSTYFIGLTISFLYSMVLGFILILFLSLIL